ncbi:MAG: diguanylate cyclase, partial [Chloroflexi bacterium]|nr:diguanylate cyclase [Chloroflexota bacterium]
MLAGTAVRVGAQRFGALAIGLPLAPLEAKVAALRNQGLVTTMVATFVGTLIAVFVSRTITHPIRALTDVATQLSQGDLDQRVSIGAGAEIGLLADTMNSMADELQNTQKKLAYDALHDGLTNLPNRTLFLDRLNHAIKKTKRVGENFFAVIFLDIDRFKLVNDSLGHAIGDLLLIEIAKRLQNCLRPGDTVARLGGDEFAMLLENITETAQVTRIADRIQEILMQPNFLEDNQIFISASIGIALSIDEDKSAEDIIRDADTAMYRAKSQGKARYEFFDPDMHAAASSLMQLEEIEVMLNTAHECINAV